MGLFDSVIGSVLSEVQKQGGLASALGPLLANDGAHGGLDGLIQKFNQAGMGDLITSWIDILPGIIDQLTPHGTAPQGGLGNAGDLMGMLGGLLHKQS
jgi:uncharacterized protein YidB (DUF937 family)